MTINNNDNQQPTKTTITTKTTKQTTNDNKHNKNQRTKQTNKQVIGLNQVAAKQNIRMACPEIATFLWITDVQQ